MSNYSLINVVVSKIIKHEALGSKTFVFSKPDGGRLPEFKAGQYISVKLQIGNSYVSRPYSICSSPKDANYAITVQSNPGGFAADRMLKDLSVGSEVVITSPQGDFCFERTGDCKNLVALAGGSGVTPFLSMARAIRDGIEDFNLTIIFGNGREQDILFKDELDAICRSTEKVKVVYALSDEKKDGFEYGFIDASMVEKYAEGKYRIFICGPGEMYRFLDSDLKKLGLPEGSIRREMLAVAKNPEVVEDKEYRIIIKDGKKQYSIKARSKEPILVAIERSGIKTRSCCRSGVCTWCGSRVEEGTYYAPSENEFRKADEIEKNLIHPCAAFPTSDMVIEIPGEKI